MRDGRVVIYRVTAGPGAVVVLAGLSLLLARSVDGLRPVGAFLVVLGAVLLVASIVRLRRLQL